MTITNPDRCRCGAFFYGRPEYTVPQCSTCIYCTLPVPHNFYMYHDTRGDIELCRYCMKTKHDLGLDREEDE